MAFARPLFLSRLSPALIAAFLASMLLLLIPAIWNRFPFLFFDSGAYFERTFDGTLSAGRSMIYGAWLAYLRYPNFWPVVIAQSALSVWIIYLMLRSHGLRGRRVALPVTLLAVSLFLTVATALPWFAGQLMPDLFAGLAVLSLYLLVLKQAQLNRFECYGLIALIVFASAAHNATLAVMIALTAAAAFFLLIRRSLLPAAGLKLAAVTLVASAIAVPSVNFLYSGQFAWTPGGSSFIFSRLVQDGIAQRYLADNCPDPSIKLCKFEKQIPKTADDFLWHQGPKGPFVSIGGWVDGAEEMRRITRESLTMYPWMHVTTALYSTGLQLVRVKSGDGLVREVWSAYAAIERLYPESNVAVNTSRQRFNLIQRTIDFLNRFHVPLTLGSMALLPLMLLLAWRRGRLTDMDKLAATLMLALLANAFVTGVLSNPHHRYGARIAWAAPFFWSLIAVQLLLVRKSWQETAARWLAGNRAVPKAATIEVRNDER
ncbi:MAG TPA: hypothetical protein PL193_03850 [Xanthobacteraceae bacterium]|nr:hypothetical protein [Xanthobacteraceae bacterium]